MLDFGWYNESMWADIADWIKVNILNNPQVFKSIIALIIMMVGLFLFSKRPTERKLLKNKRVWGTFLFVCGIVLFLQANLTDLADVFTVLATIVLAAVAVFSFEESRRLRKQYAEREERDRKERLLKEISDWAEDAFRCFITAHPDTIPKIIKENRVRLAPIEAKNTIMINLANEFGKAFQAIVKEAATNLDNYFYYFEPGREKSRGLNIEELPKVCKDSFVEVLKAVANLRTKEKS
jgi:preprotein translocase subunit YajC